MKWANLLPLLAVVAVAVVYVRWARPRIRQSRYERWERAGLLPEQTGERQPDRSDHASGDEHHNGTG